MSSVSDDVLGDDEGGPEPQPAPPRDRRRYRSIRDSIRGAFFDNAALKFVALVLALTIFILVQSDEDVHVSIDLGLSYLLPDDRVLVTERPEKVRITVRGTRRQTRRFSEREHDRLYIDLKDHRASEFVFRDDMVSLPEGLDLVRLTPESFRTEFERRIEKTAPVEVRTSGKPERGYVVKSKAAEPNQVLIRGAESQVLATTTVKTQEIPLDGRNATFSTVVPLVAPGRSVDIVDESEVEAEIRLEPEQGVRRLDAVPIVVRPGADSNPQSADQFSAEPSTVTVVLRGAVLDIEEVEPKKLEAYVEVFNVDVALNRSRKARVNIKAPQNVGIEISPPEVTLRPK